jgi:hypothetical protein
MGSRLRREYDIRMEETLADAELDIIIDEMLDDAEDIVHGSRSTQMREELFLRSYPSFCINHPQFKTLVHEGKDLSGPADDLTGISTSADSSTSLLTLISSQRHLALKALV